MFSNRISSWSVLQKHFEELPSSEANNLGVRRQGPFRAVRRATAENNRFPYRSCLLKELLILRLAHRITYLTNSQARSCLLKGLLVLQPSATHRVTCLANSRPGLACSRSYWSCSLLTGLPILQLTGSVLLAQGITGLAALDCSQSYLSCKLTAWSCCSRDYWSCSSQLAHRVTYLANSRLAVCSANSFTESSVSDRPRFRFRNRPRCSCERLWSSSPQGVIRRFFPLGLGVVFGGWPFVGDRLRVPLGLNIVSSRRCRELSACLLMN
jgi:hypothetical protein